MRIALVVPSLSLGGTERVGSEMANYWAADGHEITVITSRSADDDFYSLRPEVTRVALGEGGASSGPFEALLANRAHVRAIRRALQRYPADAVLAFIDRTAVRTLIAARSLGVPVIVAERNDLTIRSAGRVWELLRRRVYPRAAAIVVQTERAKDALAAALPRLPRVEVIPNFVADLKAPASAPSVTKQILAVGRLHPQKGFDLLLEAFACLAPQYPDWVLTLLGEGSERTALAEQAAALGLQNRVKLPGAVPDPGTEYRRSAVFALSSRYEGFPNVLLEAMACGLPPVAFDCPAGPREIIRHGENGLLVEPENPAELASALSALMGDAALRARLGTAAREVCSRYGKPAVLARWQALIESCTGSSRRNSERKHHPT